MRKDATLVLRVELPVYEAIAKAATKKQQTMSAWVRGAMIKYLQQQGLLSDNQVLALLTEEFQLELPIPAPKPEAIQPELIHVEK